jgi:hypothetical protein
MYVTDDFKIAGYFTFECYDKNGHLKWRDRTDNLVVNVGLQKALDDTLLGGTQDSTWWLGLTDGTPSFAAGDTMASHAGWTEFDEYTGNRKAYTATRSSQTVSNSASVAAFSINASGTVGGGFLNTDETGTSGTLFSGSALSADRSVVNGDTINLTYTVTASAS